MLTASVLACVGCIKISSTTTTEEISLSGPSLDGDGKVLDLNLPLAVMRQTPCKVTLQDSAGKQLFQQTVPAGKSLFTIAAERGSLLIKRTSPSQQNSILAHKFGRKPAAKGGGVMQIPAR
jgi:hypothetical protein